MWLEMIASDLILCNELLLKRYRSFRFQGVFELSLFYISLFLETTGGSDKPVHNKKGKTDAESEDKERDVFSVKRRKGVITKLFIYF